MDPDTQLLFARQQEEEGDTPAAERTLRELLAAFPLHARGLHLLATILMDSDRSEEALAMLRRAAAAAPENPAISNTLAACLANRGDLQHASEIWRQLHETHPAVADYCHHLGRLAQHQSQLDEAMAWFYKALRLQPASLATSEELSDLLRMQHDFVACGQVLVDALSHFPENVSLHLRLSYALMMTGQLGTGWRELEWRRLLTEKANSRHVQKPEWTGEELTDRTILLFCEQGIGDTLQFVRYAPILAAQGAKVIVECQPEIKSLLIHMPALSAVRAVGEQIPPFDCQLPLMSVPRVVGITRETIPATVPYLAPDPRKIKTWAARLGPPRPGIRRVGLVWAGSPHNPNEKRRSVPLASLAPLTQNPDLEFHSLQKGPAADDLVGTDFPIIDHTRYLTNFEETAGLIANLDLVISIDTAVAHLASALNHPVWVLLADLCDWRWMATREDTPWYPSMRLFRQSTPNNWTAPLKALEDALNLFAASRLPQ